MPEDTPPNPVDLRELEKRIRELEERNKVVPEYHYGQERLNCLEDRVGKLDKELRREQQAAVKNTQKHIERCSALSERLEGLVRQFYVLRDEVQEHTTWIRVHNDF